MTPRCPNQRPHGLHKMLTSIQPFVAEGALFRSDEDGLYSSLVRECFPKSQHPQHKGARGSLTGQGELKKQRFDPLFTINHTMAMLRANISRLIRRTWCKTKKPERLAQHLALYALPQHGAA